jgi:hypothetical protein
MIEAGAVQSIINMLESRSNNVQRSTNDLLSNMVEQRTISCPRMIVVLTYLYSELSGYYD